MTTAIPDQLRPPTDLDTGATAALADRLNATLADSFALYLKTKNFHWHVSGPYFRDYHLLFDEQAAQILLSTDAIAERVRKTGNTTVRSIGDIARRQIGRAHVCTPVTNAQLVCRLPLDTKNRRKTQ